MRPRTPIVLLALLLLALVPLLAAIAAPFFMPFLVAAILSVVIAPLNARMMRRLRHRGWGTFVTTLVTVLLLTAVVGVAGFTLTRELASAYDALNRRSFEEGGWPALATHTVDRVVDAVATRLPIDRDEIQNGLLNAMKSSTEYLLKNAGAAAGGLTAMIGNGLLTAVFLYVLLLHGESWLARLSAKLPLDPGISARIVEAVRRSVVANVNGVAVVAAAQGILLSLGFWAAGVRSPALWGALGGLASFIPLVGAPLVWIPAVAGFALMGAYWKALLLGLWGGLVVGSIDNLLRPFVVSAGDKQDPLLLALAAIGGVYAFGVLGILLGPLVIALFLAVWDELSALLPPGA